MRIAPRALPGVLLALTAVAALAQPVATIELHHRSADSLITVLRPLVAPATLSGAGTQMQVHAPPSELPRVMRLVQESDRPLRRLRLALSDAPDSAEQAEPTQSHGSVTLSTGRALPSDQYGNGQLLSTHGGARREPIEVLEGEPVSISMPAPQSLWFSAKGRSSLASGPASASAAGAASATAAGAAAAPQAGGVVHFDSVADFTARVWLAGEAVAITLDPRLAGTVDTGAGPDPRQAVVYGRVGQWIALAQPRRQLGSPTAGGSSADDSGLWIRVDPAPIPNR